MPNDQDWFVEGDFNYVRYSENKNTKGGNAHDMFAFNELINSLALVKIPLRGIMLT